MENIINNEMHEIELENVNGGTSINLKPIYLMNNFVENALFVPAIKGEGHLLTDSAILVL